MKPAGPGTPSDTPIVSVRQKNLRGDFCWFRIDNEGFEEWVIARRRGSHKYELAGGGDLPRRFIAARGGPRENNSK